MLDRFVERHLYSRKRMRSRGNTLFSINYSQHPFFKKHLTKVLAGNCWRETPWRHFLFRLEDKWYIETPLWHWETFHNKTTMKSATYLLVLNYPFAFISSQGRLQMYINLMCSGQQTVLVIAVMSDEVNTDNAFIFYTNTCRLTNVRSRTRCKTS